jgi:hypothetical protein
MAFWKNDERDDRESIDEIYDRDPSLLSEKGKLQALKEKEAKIKSEIARREREQ